MLPLLLPNKMDKAGHIETVTFFSSEPRIVYPALVANDAPEAPPGGGVICAPDKRPTKMCEGVRVRSPEVARTSC